MELRQLEYFLMVTKVNSFTRAAERLYVSQPAVTNAIRSLEDELGIQLFDRSQKQALLTTEGQVFCNHVENVMHGVSKTISEINDLKNLNNGVLTLGITPLAGVYPISHLLRKFHEAYPNISLAIMEKNTATLETALVEDKADLAITIEIGENKTKKNNFIEAFPICTHELVICCATSHKFHAAIALDLEDLADESLILCQKSCLLRAAILTAFENRGIFPQISFESDHIQTIKSLVADHAGISILPYDLCKADRNLVTIPLRTSLKITFLLARKNHKYLSHAAQAFLSLTTELYL